MKLAGGAETVDVGLSGAGLDMETLGDRDVVVAVEFGWKTVEVCLHDGVWAFGGLVGLDGWKGAEDMGGVLKEHSSHNENGTEVGVVAGDDIRFGFAVHETERGEDHR